MPSVERAFKEPESSYFLFGPRGTGKSTWLRTNHPESLWIDLLRPEVLRAYSAKPERLRELIAAHSKYQTVVIDEVQKAPALLDVVHSVIEENKQIRFVLTGSNARKLKRSGVDLLAGRALLRSMHPFMASELGTSFNLQKALEQGLVPLIWDAREPEESLQTYAALYIHKEVQQEGLVRDLEAFARFLEATSFSHAAILNVTEIARECEVPRRTVSGYLEILEDLLLSFEVPVFTKRAKRQLVSKPKFYWFDPGVFCSLRPASVLDRPQEIAGAALEGLIAQHLRAWIEYSRNDCRLAYWRTKSGNEVDFVLWGQQGFWAFEVKHASTVRPQDLRSLKAFAHDYPEAEVTLLYRGSESLLIDGIHCIPCESFLSRLVPGEPILIAPE